MTTNLLPGGAELMAFLDALPEKLARNVVRGALRAGARVVADDAQARCRDSQVAEAIGVSSGRKGDLIYARVRAKGKGAFKAPWLEFGTAAHLIAVSDEERPTFNGKRGPTPVSIRVINRLARRGSLEIGKRFVGPVVQHPGAKPYPFMRPALDARGEEAGQAAAVYMQGRLTAAGIDIADNSPMDEDDDA